jgi:hypothetical protein
MSRQFRWQQNVQYLMIKKYVAFVSTEIVTRVNSPDPYQSGASEASSEEILTRMGMAFVNA